MRTPAIDSRPLPRILRLLPIGVLLLGGLAGAKRGWPYLHLLGQTPFGEFLGRSEAELLNRHLAPHGELADWLRTHLAPNALIGVPSAFRDRLGGLGTELRVLLYPRRMTPIHVAPEILLNKSNAAGRLWLLAPADHDLHGLAGTAARLELRWSSGELQVLQAVSVEANAAPSTPQQAPSREAR